MQFDTACQNKRYKAGQMNIERFHNELAMRLGYERILKDAITIEELEDPMVTLRRQGYDAISFNASDGLEMIDAQMLPELRELVDAVHQAYIATNNYRF